MTDPTISSEDLRELLDRGARVTVLDVRSAAERAEWAIPGSVHVAAYDALWREDPTVLADFHPKDGAPVVTVSGLLADAFSIPFTITAIAVLTLVSGVVVAGVMYETLPVGLRGARFMPIRT